MIAERYWQVWMDSNVSLDSSGTMEGIDKFNRQAYEVILGRVTKAFDLSSEDPKLLARYDTSPLVPPSQISKKWNNHKNYRDHGQSARQVDVVGATAV